MGNEVYANGREIACKAASGKSICAFPDVCLTPPPPPAGPIPVPYPNTAYASDTTKGSKTVMITDLEVMLKDQSTFAKSTGDEAATQSQGMGVITHQIMGEASFTSWSMDVKFEGENVDRHLDLMMHHEQCNPANPPPWTYMDRMALGMQSDECKNEVTAVTTNCGAVDQKMKCPPRRNLKKETLALKMEEDDCQRALRCMLVPYRKKSKSMCCDGQTPDHLVPASQFFQKKRGGRKGTGCSDYVDDEAPCLCAEGGKSRATHGLLGRSRKSYMNDKGFSDKPKWKVGDAAKCAGHAANQVFPQCSPGCIEAQVVKGHEAMGDDENINSSTEIKTDHEDVLTDLDDFEASLGEVQAEAASDF